MINLTYPNWYKKWVVGSHTCTKGGYNYKSDTSMCTDSGYNNGSPTP